MKETRVTVRQIKYQVREGGQGAEAILFLHFSGANLMMWARSLPYFEDRYRLILVDLKGHGKSDRPASGYHMDQLADEVAGAMQQLELAQVHIVGSSLGAEVGLSMAANYPEKVRSLVCDGALCDEFGPYGTWEGSEADFEAHVADHLEKIRNAPAPSYPTLEALVEDRQKIFEEYGWWNAYHEAMVRYDAYLGADGQFKRGMGKLALEDYMGHYYQYRFEDYYPKVKCPVLMLADKDLEEGREKEAMQGLRDLTTRGQIAEVEGWAHPYCWLLNPEEACKAILEFLDDPAH